MPIQRVEIKLFLVFLIITSLVSQASVDLKHDKNQKISPHFLKSELQDAGQLSQTSEKNVKAIVYVTEADKVTLLKDYATIEMVSGNLVQVNTTSGKLSEISELPYVGYIRKPKFSHLDAVVNEGIARMEAQKLHNLSIMGNGVKIAILDAGFKNYQSLLGTALPANVITKSFRTDRDISAGEDHGTAVAELVYGIAPGAQLYLVNYEIELEFQQALTWLIQQKVDIISHSAGYTIGPFDGTGTIDDIVNNAIDHGVVWINSAGNYATQHWEGRFTDLDGNNFNEFSINGDESQSINVQAGDLIEVSLSWDDWVNVNQDYDLYLADANGNFVADSVDSQNGRPGQEPAEELTYQAPSTGVYRILIKKYSATRDVFFQLYCSTHDLKYQVPSSSLAIPSDVQRVIAVGATSWRDDSLESFSSRGPTLDGRIKPDIMAPDGVSTVTFGQHAFFGTSASAPNAAGSAALLISTSNLSVNDLKAALENTALDLGQPGKDNLYGAGRIDIYNSYKQVVPPHIYILHPGSQVFNLNDTILVYGSSNRILEPVNITINGQNYTHTFRQITRDDGSWGTGWNTSNLIAGNYTINASMSSASSGSSVILVNRSLVLKITPESIFSGVPGSIIANVRDLTGSPVLGAEVTLRGDNFIPLSNLTDQNGNSTFLITAEEQVNATATKTDYSKAVINITVRQLAGIFIAPYFVLMEVNESRSFTTYGIADDGFMLPINAAWISSNISAGSIDSNGTIIAIGRGTSNITAKFGNLSASASVTAGNVSNGTLERILPSNVMPGENFTVTLVPSGLELFSAYMAVENIPYMPVNNTTLVLKGMNGTNITYNLTAPRTNGTYIFSGRFEDKNHDVGDISGATALVVGNLVSGYDFNGNGRIEKDEAVRAVIDYFSGIITRQEAIQVVLAYFNA